MTREELIQRFPQASESTIRRNVSSGEPYVARRLDVVGETSCAKPEPIVRHALPRARQRAAADSPRYVVRITSFRRRLCDPDNLCGKYFVDCLRYSGIIPDDTAAIMDYSIRQQKARKGEERTEIVVMPVPEISAEEAAAGYAAAQAQVLKDGKVAAK